MPGIVLWVARRTVTPLSSDLESSILSLGTVWLGIFRERQSWLADWLLTSDFERIRLQDRHLLPEFLVVAVMYWSSISDCDPL